MKDPKIVGENYKRKIFYSLDNIGAHVRLYGKSKYRNIDINQTAGNKVFFIIHLKYMEGIKYLSYITKNGSVIESKHFDFTQDGYILLATIKFDQDWKDMSHIFSPEDFQIVTTYCNNQIRSTSKGYHFGTSGETYSFGYTPIYSKNPTTGHSVNRYADSKLQSYIPFFEHIFCNVFIRPNTMNSCSFLF